MTYDFDSDGRFPMFAVDPVRGGGVESSQSLNRKPEAAEEEEEQPEASETVQEKTQHA